MPAEPERPEPDVRPGTVLQGGRAKAYRPLSTAARAEAFTAGVAAYERGDFFEAHELLEPAWMGTPDPLERELYQGLIKLAAAFVHEVRGNSAGVTKNLQGARERLGRVLAGSGDDHGLDIRALLVAIDDDLAALEMGTPVDRIVPPRLERRPRSPR